MLGAQATIMLSINRALVKVTYTPTPFARLLSFLLLHMVVSPRPNLTLGSSRHNHQEPSVQMPRDARE